MKNRTNTPSNSLRRLGRRLWRVFLSVKTGIVLLAVIAGVCIYGTVFYAASSDWGDSAIPLAKARVFNANWFFALLTLFFVQFVLSTWHVTVMSCTIWWKRLFHRDPRYYTGPREGRAQVRVPGGMARVEQVLRRRFTRAHREGNAFFAHKGLLQRMGPTVIHAGIIVILLAGLVRIILDRQGRILSEGRFLGAEGETVSSIVAPRFMDSALGPNNIQTIPVRHEITVLDFDEILHANSTQPEYFSSLLKVRDPQTGETVVAKLDMNHSLRIGPFEYHQAGYQKMNDPLLDRTNFDVRDALTGERIAVTDASPETRVQVGDEDLFLEVEGKKAGDQWRLYTSANPRKPIAQGPLLAQNREVTLEFTAVQAFASFRIRREEETGKLTPYDAGGEPDNPALQVRWTEGGVVREQWLFLSPDLASQMPPQSDLVRLALEDVQLPKDTDPKAITWAESDELRFVVTAQTREDGEVLRRGTLNRGGSLQVTVTDQASNPSIPAEAEYVVVALGPTPRYVTILQVVNEPVVPYYIFGVAIIAIGAGMTFLSRYRSFHGLFDEETGLLRVALVPRFGKSPDPKEFQSLLEELSSGEGPGDTALPDEASEEIAVEPEPAGVS